MPPAPLPTMKQSVASLPAMIGLLTLFSFPSSTPQVNSRAVNDVPNSLHVNSNACPPSCNPISAIALRAFSPMSDPVFYLGRLGPMWVFCKAIEDVYNEVFHLEKNYFNWVQGITDWLTGYRVFLYPINLPHYQYRTVWVSPERYWPTMNLPLQLEPWIWPSICCQWIPMNNSLVTFFLHLLPQLPHCSHGEMWARTPLHHLFVPHTLKWSAGGRTASRSLRGIVV